MTPRVASSGRESQLSAALSQTLPDNRTPVLDVSRSDAKAPVVLDFLRVRQATGLSNTALVSAFTKLAIGPGKISFGDFVRLRLFDPAFHGGAALAEFVGQRRNCWMCETVNYRHDWFGLMSNKIAGSAYLSRYGLPAIPVSAIYAPEFPGGNRELLSDRQQLEQFLTSPGNYPLFGKPVEGGQSLGSVGLHAFRAAERQIETTTAHRIELDQLLSEIETNYRVGYVFQPLIHPDPAVAQLCGDRIACVRIITALTEEGPKIMRACWKIPAGANMADNYWRAGNLLAQIDMQSGRVLRVSSGAGLGVRFHESHPDSGVALTGFAIPAWPEMKQLALSGAALMRHIPLIGWDLAPSENGPIIVEMNEAPDFFMVQFADRRGMLDEEFRSFMAFQVRNSDAHKKHMTAAIAKL
jgi:hypothetical protein